MNKKEALKRLEEYHRYSINPNFAEEIANAFGCELNKKLIRTTKGYRELIQNPAIPRVNTCDLAQDICEQLKVKPDEKLMNTANRMFGVGSMMELSVKACVKALSNMP